MNTTGSGGGILFLYSDVFMSMEKRTFKIYDLIPVQRKITPSKIEITNEVFEKLKSVGLNTQTDTILFEVTHDDLFSFVGFAVEQTINSLVNKKWRKTKRRTISGWGLMIPSTKWWTRLYRPNKSKIGLNTLEIQLLLIYVVRNWGRIKSIWILKTL